MNSFSIASGNLSSVVRLIVYINMNRARFRRLYVVYVYKVIRVQVLLLQVFLVVLCSRDILLMRKMSGGSLVCPFNVIVLNPYLF